MIIFRHPDSNAPASVCPESYSSGIRSNSRRIFYGTRRCGFANRFPCFPKRSSSNRFLPQNSERAQLPMSRYPLRSPTGKDSCPVRLPPGEAGLPPVCPASLPNRLLFLTCPILFQVLPVFIGGQPPAFGTPSVRLFPGVKIAVFFIIRLEIEIKRMGYDWLHL